MEPDDAFFTTEIQQDKKDKPLKRGRGSQSKVPVMAESTFVDSPKNIRKPKSVRHIKMQVINDLKSIVIKDRLISSINNG